jgi:hypothetical protein
MLWSNLSIIDGAIGEATDISSKMAILIITLHFWVAA